MSEERIGFGRRVGRSLRLRCPRCGQGKLFAGWFAMHPRCESCGLDFRREPGFYLGSIYVNYGLTAAVVTVTFVTAQIMGQGRNPILFWTMGAWCLLFPLWFFRYARSLWLGMDQYVDADSAKR
jgi:uncharacterized protein (DUF983 family)